MEKYLTENQVKTILDGAPKGTNPDKIIEGLVSRGYTLQGLNDQQEVPEVKNKTVSEDTSLVGKAKAFAGGVAEGVGTDLPLMAIDYLGKKAVENVPTFGSQTLGDLKQKGLSNLEKAQPLTQQFEDITNQTENPITAGLGNVVGIPVGLATGAAEVKAIPAVAKTLAKRDAAKTENFIKELITPEMSTKATTEAIKTGKVTEAGLKGTRDVTGAIPFFEDTVRAVSEVKGISPKKTLLENTNAIHDSIGGVADDLVKQLKNAQTQIGKDRGFFSPNEFKGYMIGVKQTLADNPTIVGDAEKTASKILSKFNSLVAEKGYTPTGLLEARKALDSWMKNQKGSKVFDPNTENAVSIALRAIRQGGNEFLAGKVPDVAVLDMLKKQTNLYNAIEQIAPKAAKEGANTFQRWVKANPKTVNLLKLGGAAAVGGGAVGAISQ